MTDFHCVYFIVLIPDQLETEKNKLENVLNNNLTKKRERLQQELREVSIEEQDKRLTGFRQDKEEVEKRMSELDSTTHGIVAELLSLFLKCTWYKGNN